MNILVIFTGGTIGSIEKDGFIQTGDTTRYSLIEHFLERTSHKDIHFFTDCPYTILSEQLDGCHINHLISCIRSHLERKKAPFFDGIIVTHGTDTLQYTASALSLMLQDSPIPIVLVSSNYILSDAKANGHDNFKYAVEFIFHTHTNPESNLPEKVFVSYRNDSKTNATNYIHSGYHLLPHAPYSDLLYSLSDNYYGYFEESCFVENKNYVSYSNILEKKDYFENGILINDILKKELSKSAPVLFLKMVPGMCFPCLEGSHHIKAILIESYHSGTLCTNSEPFLSFVKTAKERKLPIFLIGMEDRTQYESTKKYDNLGIQVLPRLSPVFAYILLWYQFS